MSNLSKPGFGIVGTAVILGVLGDALLKVGWGVNFPIWISVAVASGWALSSSARGPNLSAWPIWTALAFSALFAWRDSEFLLVWDFIVVLGCLSVLVLESSGITLKSGSIANYVMAGPRAAILTVRGFFAQPTDGLAWGELERFRKGGGGIAVGIGLSIPVLMVFGSLLVSADSGFSRVAQDFFNVDFESLFDHLFATAIITWMSAGYLASVLVGTKLPGNSAGFRPRLGIVEVGTPLGVLALLFLSFLMMQANYLFGGEAAMRSAGMTFAEYAREGFQQLTVASALAIPLLLASDWFFSKRTPRDLKIFRSLTIAIIVLVGLLMVSALHRIAMYVGQYGLTELRLYARVFMFWLGVVYVILIGTVMHGRPELFAFRAIAAGIAILFALNLSNPDAIVARSHLSHVADNSELDTEYLSRLSADAIPTLAAHSDRFDKTQICQLQGGRLAGLISETDGDWRSFNLSRTRARNAIQMIQQMNIGCEKGNGIN